MNKLRKFLVSLVAACGLSVGVAHAQAVSVVLTSGTQSINGFKSFLQNLTLVSPSTLSVYGSEIGQYDSGGNSSMTIGSRLLTFNRVNTTLAQNIRFRTGGSVDWIIGEGNVGTDHLLTVYQSSNSVNYLRFDPERTVVSFPSPSVGIGTTNPSSNVTSTKLHVSGGNIALDASRGIGLDTADGSDSGRLSLTASGGDPAGGQARGAFFRLFGNEHATNPGEVTVSAGNVTGGVIKLQTNSESTRLRIDESGNVQMGSGATVSTITSTGEADFAAGVTVRGQETVAGTMTVQGNAFSVGTSTLSVSNGLVGVGTTSPLRPLHVSGASVLSGTTDVVGGSLTARTSIGDFAATVNNTAASGTRPNGLLVKTDNVSTTLTDPVLRVTAGSTNLLDVNAGGFLALGAGGGFSSQLTVASTLTVQGNAFSVGASTFVVTASSVGIGTTSPLTTLDVNGGLAVRSAGTFTSTLAVQGNAFSVGTSTLAVSGGLVGVGTTSPLRLLHVAGAARIAGTTDVDNGTLTVRASIGDFAATVNNTAAGATRPSGLLVKTDNVSTTLTDPVLRITAGSVNLLDVNAGGLLALGAGGGFSSQVTLSGSTLTVGGNAFSVAATTLTVSGGQVGIATTRSGPSLLIGRGGKSPATLSMTDRFLQIGGDEAGVGTYFGIGLGHAGGTQFSPAYIGYIETSNSGVTAGDMVFHVRSVTTDTSPPERVRVTGAGSMGIGTTSPAVRLHVDAGGFRVSTAAAGAATFSIAESLGTLSHRADNVDDYSQLFINDDPSGDAYGLSIRVGQNTGTSRESFIVSNRAGSIPQFYVLNNGDVVHRASSTFHGPATFSNQITASSATLNGTSGEYDLILSTGIRLVAGCIQFPTGRQCNAAGSGTGDFINANNNVTTGINTSSGAWTFNSSMTITGRIISSQTIAASGDFVGSSGALQWSVGVASITRVDVGQYAVNFSTAMPTAGYTATVSAESNSTVDVYCFVGTGGAAGLTGRLASQFPIRCTNNTTTTPVDPALVNFSVTGPMQ